MVVYLAHLRVVTAARLAEALVGVLSTGTAGVYLGGEGGEREGGGVVEVDELPRRDPRTVGRIEAGDAEPGLRSRFPDKVHRTVSHEGGVGQVGRAAERERVLREALVRVCDGVLEAHRPVPGGGGWGEAGAHGVHVLWGLPTDPGAIRVFIGTGLVRFLENVEAVKRVRL